MNTVRNNFETFLFEEKMAIKTRQQKPHLIIDAGPGCGKTTTMIAALNIMKGNKPDWFDNATDEQKAVWESIDGVYTTIAFQAFNKSIAEELKEKVPNDVEAKTFHSFGYAALRDHGYKTRMSGDNVKYMIKDMLGYDRQDRMSREHFDLSLKVAKVVSLLKNNLLDPTIKNVTNLVRDNGIDVDNIKQVTKLSNDIIMSTLRIQPGEIKFIDFDDMIWLPVALDLDFSDTSYDLLICDESQDLNPVQHALVCRSGVRLVCVGDPRQAVYGFRGADSNSMNTLEKILGATKRGVEILPLQISFRLPKSGVANVNNYAPDLKPLPNAIEGEINEVFYNEAEPQPGDLIVSRINANIFSLAFQLLQKRIAVRIQGREFGNQLKKVITNRCGASGPIENAQKAISEFDMAERTRLSKKTFPERLLDAHNEKIVCLDCLASGCKTIEEMLEILDTLFDSNLPKDKVVLLSTIHRAKGLEADTVWFLEPQLVPHPMAKRPDEKKQEMNLKFVAETRHKKRLVYILPNNEEKRDEEEGRLAVSDISE
jgi:DNA helicase-2/ATP-dependent DNA helicase PcrA